MHLKLLAFSYFRVVLNSVIVRHNGLISSAEPRVAMWLLSWEGHCASCAAVFIFIVNLVGKTRRIKPLSTCWCCHGNSYTICMQQSIRIQCTAFIWNVLFIIVWPFPIEGSHNGLMTHFYSHSRIIQSICMHICLQAQVPRPHPPDMGIEPV